jgi:hypothetical protein
MSKVSDSIRRGLEEAVAYARGETTAGYNRIDVQAPGDPRAVRTTLRDVKRKDRRPTT